MTAPESVTFFKPQMSHFVETMACFLAADPQLKVRVATTRERGAEFTEHPWILDRLEKQERIELVDLDATPRDSSLLVFGLVRHRAQPPALNAWLRQSAEVAIFPEANHYGSRADWLRELVRSFPQYLRARFVILERESRALDFRFGCRRRVLYTPSVHPQFQVDPARREAMFGPVPEQARRFRITFLGNRQPPERSTRLDACLAALRAEPALPMTADYHQPPGVGQEVLWIEYDLAAGTRGLDPSRYAAALAETDFCLSPPGWGRNWAHRTIEAMARGAIPVLEDPELYNLPLVDGRNCVIAPEAGWAGAVRRCLALSTEEIARMRAEVLRLRESRLLPAVAAREFGRAFMTAWQS